jgi:histone-lysine N-methyltransferase SUV39H
MLSRLYNEYNRTYLFDIDFWYIKLYMKKKRRKFKKGEVRLLRDTDKIAYYLQYCVDAMHAGCFTRYFNHSCDPNSIIVPCVFGEAYPEIPYLAFFTIELIPKDKEITFSYQGGTITDDRERNAARLRADAKRRLGKKKTLKPGTKTFGTIDAPCACGTLLCRGSMWNQESDEDEEDDELDGSDASGSD